MLETLKRCCEWYWGLAPEPAEHQTKWAWSTTGPLSGLGSWQWLFLFLICVISITLLTCRSIPETQPRRRFFYSFRRCLFCLLFLITLSGLRVVVQETVPPVRALVIDSSWSMSLVDQMHEDTDERLSRRDWVIQRLTANDNRLLNKLATDSRLEIYLLADQLEYLGQWNNGTNESILATLVSTEPSGRETRFRSSLSSLFKGQAHTDLSSLVLFTDGISSAGEQEGLVAFVEQELPLGFEIEFIGVGNTEPIDDLSLNGFQMSTLTYINEPVRFSAKIGGTDFDWNDIKVQLRNIDSDEVLLSKSVSQSEMSEDGELKLEFVPLESGLQQYELDFGTDEIQEVFLENNRLRRRLFVAEEPLKILLADRLPRYEYRFLKSLLERNESITLHTFLESADSQVIQQDETAIEKLPAGREQLQKYDVLILGDLLEEYLHPDNAVALVDFVRAGGGIIWIAGEQFTRNELLAQLHDSPLAGILPVLHPVLSEVQWWQAKIHPAPSSIADNQFPFVNFGLFKDNESRVYGEFAPFSGAYSGLSFKETALPVLVDSNQTSRPVAILQRFGRGALLFNTFDESWRWRFQKGDQYHGQYWIQAVRYLAVPEMSHAGLSISERVNDYPASEMKRLNSDYTEMKQAVLRSDGNYTPWFEIDQWEIPSLEYVVGSGSNTHIVPLWNRVEILLLMVGLLSWGWIPRRLV